MEFGKLSGAPLSKSYTVALLYRSAAAAEKMKEAEVVKKKIIKVGGGGGERGGKPPPPEAGETLSIIWFYTAECSHRRGTVYGVKRRKSSKHSGSRRGSCAFPAERSWEAGRREPASQGQAPAPQPPSLRPRKGVVSHFRIWKRFGQDSCLGLRGRKYGAPPRPHSRTGLDVVTGVGAGKQQDPCFSSLRCGSSGVAGT